MNLVDLLIIGAFAFGVYSGYRRGAVVQVFSWGGFVVGLLVGGLAARPIVRAINPSTPQGKTIAGLVAMLGIAFMVEAVIAFGGAHLARRITAVKTKQVDRIVGSIVTAMLALVSAWIISVPAKKVPSLSEPVRRSVVIRGLYSTLDQPPDFLAGIASFFSKFGPDIFGLNPSLAPTVDPPPPSLANNRRILGAAELTYKIESLGCEGRVDGSGFPARADTVITAAHVLAGTSNTRVIEARTGRSYRATVVYMDKNRDIAVLRVPTLPNSALFLEDEAAPRGTDGAAIGYPQGGPRKISPARVRARVDAGGYDIYSRRQVVRNIYVLHAQVIQGNSGGPFVDETGRVRGMIFAASAQNANEAYALTEREISRALRAAEGRRTGVNTGACAL